VRIWFPLLAVPTLALLDQSVAYVMTIWSCTHQNSLAMHAVHAPFFVAAAIGVVIAWQRRRELAAASDKSDRRARRHFLAGLALGMSALSVLVIVAMWSVTWVLRSCVY
jgi:hypothetical protein